MIVIELDSPSNWTLVIDQKGWYIRVEGDLYDKRHNNEFLIFEGGFIDLYIDNLKLAWNDCVKKVLAAVDLYGDFMLKNCDEENSSLGYLIETSQECVDFENGLIGWIEIGDICVSDLKLMRGLIAWEDDDSYMDRYYFYGVVDLHFNQFKNARISFKSRAEIDFFINSMRMCEKVAQEAKEGIMLALNNLEKKYLNKDFEFNLNIKTFFSKYELNSNILPFKPKIGKPSVIDEHGRSRF